MKIKLKNFPNGARVVYEHKEFVKRASKVRDHFCLVELNPSSAPGDRSDVEPMPMCLYLHRDTYVEPVMSAIEI